MALLAAAFSSVVFGIADFAGGYATRRLPVRQVVLYSQAIGLLCVGVAAPLIGADEVAPADLAWGAAAGLSGMVALMLFYEGLAKGRISVVSPLAAIIGIALPVGFGVLIGERPGLLAVLGIVAAIPAIALISTSEDQSEPVLWRGGVAYGLAAGAGFGGFFILISRSAEASGMWPLVGARTASVVAMAIVLLATRSFAVPDRTHWKLVALAGVADILANVFFVIAVRGSLLILASVIVSLYPVSTLVLARLVLGERTSNLQRVGLALGAAAVVAISIG